MDKKATLSQALFLIALVIITTFLAFKVPFLDLTKEGNVSSPVCKVFLSVDNLTLKEGNSATISATVVVDKEGDYKISLQKIPSVQNVNINAHIKDQSSFDFSIFNVSSSSLHSLGQVSVNGPTSCFAPFTLDIIDNCPFVFNPDQKDTDKDGIGDVCDSQICGNNICELGENSSSCCSDCPCKLGQICNGTACTGTVYACSLNKDCNDSIACTVDFCYFANTSRAFCGHDSITNCSGDFVDGCCPIDCNGNTDIDCTPKCGNGICEDFFGKETLESCLQDCAK